MNYTQRINSDWLLQSGLEGDELLLEGLLRRGFLAYRDKQGVWLGVGSHPSDIDVLRLVDGIEVKSVPSHKYRMARVKLTSSIVSSMSIAIAIVFLPENHYGRHSSMTGYGVPDFWGRGWGSYRNMVWGAKLAVCPTIDIGKLSVYNALDLGVTLLVKAFPLARVATSSCCDGHGIEPAQISFQSDWDFLWGKAVFDTLFDAKLKSKWNWESKKASNLKIEPKGEYSDASVLNMLNDIQHFSRLLLKRRTIDKIGLARVRTLDTLGHSKPTPERFAQQAQRELSEQFSK